MVLVLKVLGWFGISVSIANVAIKIFATNESLGRYAGGSRNLDMNISTIAVCLIFLALAAILQELREQNGKSE